jgi:hypothetical protein
VGRVLGTLGDFFTNTSGHPARDSGPDWNDEFENLQFELKNFDPGWTGRAFSISNISLVITYVTLVVAAVMLAGFMWVAFAFSDTRETGSGGFGYGYSGYRRKRSAFEEEQEGTYVEQGCQMVCFQTKKNNIFFQFWQSFQWKILMFYDHFNTLWPFALPYGNLVYVIAIFYT